MFDSQRKTANVMPAGEQKTVESNGVTFSSDGKGRYHISGTASAPTSIRFNLVSGFTTPISVSNGGLGTLSFFNNLNYAVSLTFCNGATNVDSWQMSTANRTSTAYNAVGNKYVDNVVITVTSGATVDITIMPEFTNDGVLPESFEPHWQHSLRKLGTSTDTLTTLPVDVYADGTNATVGLVGNMSQTGTPSPATPIQPQECGERTGNLFDYSKITVGKYINASGEEVASTGTGEDTLSHSDFMEIVSNQGYTFYKEKQNGASSTNNAFCWFDENKNLISRDLWDGFYNVDNIQHTSVAPSNAKYLIINFRGTYYNTSILNLGNIVLPEPYGYKIPILSGGTTTPVYLGEVETTRRIRKLVLTGSETVFSSAQTNTSGLYCFVYDYAALSMDDIINYLDDMSTIPYPFFVSSHFKMKTATKPDSFKDIADGEVGANSNATGVGTPNRFIVFCKSGITTAADFKAYLAAQYAAGTPVCVWYVLATETTGIVNEPIRKIGDYADTVSGITIPTITGKDSFDILTTLKPSEVSLAYTGWHDASVKERVNGQWE